MTLSTLPHSPSAPLSLSSTKPSSSPPVQPSSATDSLKADSHVHQPSHPTASLSSLPYRNSLVDELPLPHPIPHPSSSSPSTSPTLKPSSSHPASSDTPLHRPSSPPPPSGPPPLFSLPVSVSRRLRWQPHPQVFRVEEEPAITDEDAHWQYLCRLHPPTSLYRYFPSSLSFLPPPSPPPAPSLTSALSQPFTAALRRGIPVTHTRPRALPLPGRSATLSISFLAPHTLTFGTRTLPLASLHRVAPVGALTLSLHAAHHRLTVRASSSAIYQLYWQGFKDLIAFHHAERHPSVYDPTAFLRHVQLGVPARRHSKSAAAPRAGLLAVSIRDAELHWMEDASPPVPRRWWQRSAHPQRTTVSLLSPELVLLCGQCTKAFACGVRPDEAQCFTLLVGSESFDFELTGASATSRDVFVRGLKDLIEVLHESAPPRGSAQSKRTRRAPILDPVAGPSLPQRRSLVEVGRANPSSSGVSHGSLREKRREMDEARREREQSAPTQSAVVSAGGEEGPSTAGSSRSSVSLSSSLSLGDGGVGEDDWADFDMTAIVTRPRSTGVAPMPPTRT